VHGAGQGGAARRDRQSAHPLWSLDVLSQFLVGSPSTSPGPSTRRSTSSGREPLQGHHARRVRARARVLGEVPQLKHRSVYAKIWIDRANHRFGGRQGARLIYFTNVGTIPESPRGAVLGEGRAPGQPVEKFIERVRPKEVFVLGGKTYEFIQTKGTKVFVRDAKGRKPTSRHGPARRCRAPRARVRALEFRDALGRRWSATPSPRCWTGSRRTTAWTAPRRSTSCGTTARSTRSPASSRRARAARRGLQGRARDHNVIVHTAMAGRSTRCSRAWRPHG